MNGAEHYRQAEILLGAAMDQGALGRQMSDRTREFSVAQAQVHATLALVCASEGAYNGSHAEAWREATS